MGTEFGPIGKDDGSVEWAELREAQRIAKADKRYAMDYSARENGWATQGAADYCTRNGHATLTVDGVVQGYCPRCLDLTERDDDVIVVAPWPTAENDYSVTGGLDPHDETLDMQGVPEWLDLIEARVHKDFSSQAGVQSHHDYARMTRDQIQRIYN